jgi:esterase/lipase
MDRIYQVVTPSSYAILIFLLFFSVISMAAEQEKQQIENPYAINFAAEDGFELQGNYYAGELEGAGALLLHDCNHTRKSYELLAKLLASEGIHTLTMDFRGYGESISDEFSRHNIKRRTRDIVEYQSELAKITAYWPADVISAYQFLQAKTTRNQKISVVAMGCAAEQAVALAEKIHINNFVMISPQMEYIEKERFKNLFDMPVYFTSSAHNIEAYKTATELFEWNGDKLSKFHIFKGSRSGHALLNGDNYLARDIASWLKIRSEK